MPCGEREMSFCDIFQGKILYRGNKDLFFAECCYAVSFPPFGLKCLNGHVFIIMCYFTAESDAFSELFLFLKLMDIYHRKGS